MPVDLVVADGVGQLILNRPDSLNALDAQMRREWVAAWRRVSEDNDVRVVIVTGAGHRAFCVGSDLKEHQGEGAQISGPFGSQQDDHLLHPMSTDKPLICAINGHALGGGLEIALACDIRIAASSATMGLPEVRVGSMPGAGGTQNLPRAVGSSHAMYLLLTGERIDAARALQIGLVSECVDAAQLMPRAQEIAQIIAGNAPLAVRATRQMAKASWDWPQHWGLQAERNAWWLLKSTKDRAEGRAAFRESRAPQYKGW